MAKPWPERPVSPYQGSNGNKSGQQWQYDEKMQVSNR